MALWDSEVQEGKEKIRHLFLFPHELLITKPTKSGSIEEYEYKHTCRVRIQRENNCNFASYTLEIIMCACEKNTMSWCHSHCYYVI